MLIGWRIIGSQATTLAVNPGGSVIRFTASSGVNPCPAADPPATVAAAHKTNRTERMANPPDPSRIGDGGPECKGTNVTEKPESPRGRRLALLAALLGWMFDGMEMGLFPLV